jgi:hypothetical protein
MRVRVSTNSLEKQLNNIVQYSLGFLEGAEAGKKQFLDNLGKGLIFALGRYIDIEAKSNREALHHVYEWYQTGSPNARLFDLKYTVSSAGLGISSSFRQSRSLSKDATEPFYNKAEIMERGTPVTITPRSGGALRFESGGNEVFTRRPVTVTDPGGVEVQGAYERVFDEFIKVYFTQAFLRSSGIYDYIRKPEIYKKNFAMGARGGKAVGKRTGYKWIVNAKIEVE